MELIPGVTVLSGRNATNRTSFLQAIMTAVGSDWTTLKGDAERGLVELEMEEETYARTLSVTFSTRPSSDEPSYFSFL